MDDQGGPGATPRSRAEEMSESIRARAEAKREARRQERAARLAQYKAARPVTRRFAIVDPATGKILRARQCREEHVLDELPGHYPTGVIAVPLPDGVSPNEAHLTHRYEQGEIVATSDAPDAQIELVEEFGRQKQIRRRRPFNDLSKIIGTRS